MKKARFKTLEDQKLFFNSVKKKLGVGARKLSRILELKSRGSIESYTFGRTAPPLKIVRKLEELSGIRGDYSVVEGKVVRKERKFLPFSPIAGEQNLKKRFTRDFKEIDNWIKSDLSIRDIVGKIRKKKYSFDNSLISKCIGAYRTSLKIRFKEEINPKKDEIVVRGRVRQDNGTYSIGFNLINISKGISRKKIGLEFSKDMDSVRIFPLSFGRNFHVTDTNIKILVTDKSGIKDGSYIYVVLRPLDFGFSLKDSIYDIDAKALVGPLLKEGFILDNHRSTPANHKGDLSVFLNDKNYIIEITHAKSYKSSYSKIGQCYIQKMSYPNALQILVCSKSLLLPSTRKALKKMNVEVLTTSFKEKWEKEIAQKIKNLN